MGAREVRKDVYAVGALDPDRKLFDELIPLPDGTTYNSYLIRGSEKTALIDAVDPTKARELIENLKGLGLKQLDYVIANHAEQDHSGAIPDVLELYPRAQVVTNAKCKGMLMDHLNISEDRFLVIDDGGSLPLGGKTLEFIIAPWVHWPETMFTYLKEEGILFTCDFLGSHLATSELFVRDEARTMAAAKRYYAEIMMPFRMNIKKHLERIKDMKISIVATSHGPIYDRPEFIVSAYREWVSDNVKNEVVIPYVSMHGSTQIAVEHLTDALVSRGIEVKPFNLTKTDIGELAMALVDAATIIFATPTVLVGPHPQVFYAAALVGALRPKTRYFGIINSFGWAGKAPEGLESALGATKMEKIGVISIKGIPKTEDFSKIDAYAEQIRARHEQIF